jgi:hypothetical protein
MGLNPRLPVKLSNLLIGVITFKLNSLAHQYQFWRTWCRAESKLYISSRLLGGAVVSVIAIRPKFRGFRPGRGCGFLRAIKISSTPFFGGEVKPQAPYKILRHVKNLLQIRTNIVRKDRFIIPFSRPYCFGTKCLIGLPESCDEQIARFPLSTSFHRGSPCSYITCEMNSRPVVARSSET